MVRIRNGDLHMDAQAIQEHTSTAVMAAYQHLPAPERKRRRTITNVGSALERPACVVYVCIDFGGMVIEKGCWLGHNTAVHAPDIHACNISSAVCLATRF